MIIYFYICMFYFQDIYIFNFLSHIIYMDKSNKNVNKYENNNNTYDYIIFHRGCLDGFSAFFVLTLTNKIQKNAIIYPDVPSANEPPPNIDGKNIIIIDVAYKKDVLIDFFNRCNKLTFIDHHISIKDDVIDASKHIPNKNIIIIYNDHKSGVSLTWNYFFKNKKVPLFIKYIEDNDIGAWKLKYTIPFINALQVKYSFNLTHDNLNKWKKLFKHNEIKKLINIGKIYDQYKEYLLESNIKKYSLEAFPGEKIFNKFPEIFKKIGEYKVVVYNGNGCPSTSSLGAKFMHTIDCDFVIMWVFHMDKKEYVLSFRSKSVDVASIAKIWGGGGHKLAAACSFPISKYRIEDLFMPISYKR